MFKIEGSQSTPTPLLESFLSRRNACISLLTGVGAVALTSCGWRNQRPAAQQRDATCVTPRSAGRLDVRSFGAVGDGIADDTASLRAAFAAGEALRGGEVYLGPGKYRISETLRVSANVTVGGEGSTNIASRVGGTELIKAKSLRAPGLIMAGERSMLRHLVVRGERGNQGDGVLINANNASLRDVSIFQMGRDGVRVGSDHGTPSNTWSLERVVSSCNGRHGIFIHDRPGHPPDANAGTATNIMVQANEQDGLRVENCYFNTFVGVLAEQNRECGVYVGEGASWNAFYGGDSEGNAKAQFHVHQKARMNTFDVPLLHEWTSFPEGDETPSVGAYSHWQCLQTHPTVITNFEDASRDHEIVVRLDRFTRIRCDSARIRTKGCVDVAGNADSLISFRNINGIWYELWRNF